MWGSHDEVSSVLGSILRVAPCGQTNPWKLTMKPVPCIQETFAGDCGLTGNLRPLLRTLHPRS